MIYTQNRMVEMTGSGISLTRIHLGEPGSRIHALRFLPEADPAPLLKAADVYLNQNIKYDYADLLLLAGLLVFKKIPITAKVYKIVMKILLLACQALDKLYQRIKNNGNSPAMICSQLVYQCYYDCGPEYEIKIEHGLLQESGQNSIRLYDHAASPAETGRTAAWKPQDTPALSEAAVPALAMELYEALSDAAQKKPIHPQFKFRYQDLLDQSSEFIEKLERLLKQMNKDMPLPALFVTPADLLVHAQNLKQYGEASIVIDE